MYRTNDPRFRRRLNEIGQTLESANETAQSGIYIFGQTYIRPCFESIGTCFTDCIDAGCPSLNLKNRDRIRRQRGRARSGGRAELSFDFYDDWDEDENDGLLGWNNDEFDRLINASAGYGTVANAQPQRQRGMSYPKTRRRSQQDIINDPTVIPGSSSFLGKLFGGRPLRYKPSAAGLQEHPGARRLGKDVTEGEALLDESEPSDAGGTRKRPTRNRSGTAGSRETQDSFSSRGDIFPSDDEDDAVPLDDEFAMVLERRTTNSGNVSGPETEDSSNKTKRKKGKRPFGARRGSSKRTISSRSARSDSSNQPSRTSSHAALSLQTMDQDAVEIAAPTMSEIQREDATIAEEEEAEIELKRVEAHRLAAERGLIASDVTTIPPADEEHASSESVPAKHVIPAASSSGEPSQLPTPQGTDDEEEQVTSTPNDEAHQ